MRLISTYFFMLWMDGNCKAACMKDFDYDSPSSAIKGEILRVMRICKKKTTDEKISWEYGLKLCILSGYVDVERIFKDNNHIFNKQQKKCSFELQKDLVRILWTSCETSTYRLNRDLLCINNYRQQMKNINRIPFIEVSLEVYGCLFITLILFNHWNAREGVNVCVFNEPMLIVFNMFENGLFK